MNIVIVKNVTLGEGIPKVCVPVSAEDFEGLKEEAEEIRAEKAADLVEWRADAFGSDLTEEEIRSGLFVLRNALPDLPVLFTVRSVPEGGACARGKKWIAKTLLTAVDAGADLIDAELSLGESTTSFLCEKAHLAGVKVVSSFHDFNQTPSEEEMLEKIKKMESLGCDLAKIAVMPQNARDVLTLLSVTEKAAQTVSCPLITMSMGHFGVISRLCGEVFGSCMTFAAGSAPSAPGQIRAGDLKKMLALLDETY